MQAAQIQQFQAQTQPLLAQLRNQAATLQKSAPPDWQALLKGMITATTGPLSGSVQSSTLTFTNINGGTISVTPAAVLTAADVTAKSSAAAQPALTPPPKPCNL